MAGADYKNCDLCGRRTFYDASLDYSEDYERPFRVGDWSVICVDCAKTHRCQIVRRDGKPEKRR